MKKRKVPMRKCTGCQEMKNKKELIRIVKSTEGAINIDGSGKMNGRGAYICPSLECLNLAKKNKGLEKSFKMAIPEDIYNNLEEELMNID